MLRTAILTLLFAATLTLAGPAQANNTQAANLQGQGFETQSLSVRGVLTPDEALPV
ncbi:MAG: hypothetical protein ACTHXI_05070 [Halomonadaceae bacterium]